MTEITTCKNCSAQFSGRFCNHCGQRNISAGITFKETVSDFLSANFAIDGPVSETLKLLAINPGKLFRNFIAGQRKTFYKPVQFFLVATVIYLAWANLIDYDPIAAQEGRRQATANQQQAYNISLEAGRFMVTYINYFLFLLAFSFALSMKLFRSKAYRYAEYLAMGFYITGVYVLLGIVNTGLIAVGVSTAFVLFFVLWAYIAYCYISLVGKFSIKGLLSGISVALLSWLFYMIAAFGIAMIFVSFT